MATFNILSSCICRDAFGFQENCGHEIITFLQSTSPFTWFEFNQTPKRLLVPECFSDINIKNFRKKCVMLDYNKQVLSSYDEKSDFFILDLVSFANTNIAANEDEEGNKNYFTYSKWFLDAYRGGLSKYVGEKIQKIDALELLSNVKLMKKVVTSLIDWLVNRKQYKDTQIILVRNKKVNCYSDSQYLYFFNNQVRRTRVNTMLDKIYDYFEFKLPGCHVVHMPYGVYADTHHKWGLTDLHLCNQYYDYLYSCFDMIAQGQEKKNSKLFFLYSDYFEKEKNIFLQNSLQTMERKQLLANPISIGGAKEYIVCPGTKYYSSSRDRKLIEEGSLTHYTRVYEWNRLNGKIMIDQKSYFVKSDDCIKGYVGGGDIGQNGWKTQNNSTLVKLKEDSVIIGHRGGKSLAQTQIICVVDNNDKLQGKVVTLSVYARVLRKNNEGRGGTIALINANGYNGGHFYAQAQVTSLEWEKVFVSICVPEKKDFHGLTVCLRAVAGTGNEPQHAIVEYYMPQLEMGAFNN